MKYPDDLEIIVGSNEDDTEIFFIVRSPEGRKIAQEEFILEVEQWLHEVTKSMIDFRESGALLH